MRFFTPPTQVWTRTDRKRLGTSSVSQGAAFTRGKPSAHLLAGTTLIVLMLGTPGTGPDNHASSLAVHHLCFASGRVQGERAGQQWQLVGKSTSNC
jgi:hypothetical protein